MILFIQNLLTSNNCMYYIDNIYNKEKFLDYYKLIKVAVYRKKKYKEGYYK